VDLETKLATAKKLIEEHNQTLEKLSVPPFDAEKVIQNIRLSGGTSLERLKYFGHEEILDCFVITHINQQRQPVILAKEIASLFHDGETGKRRVSSLGAERMSLAELLGTFDPDDPDSPVGKRLKEVSREEPFLVFDALGQIDAVESEKLLKEVKAGYQGRGTIPLRGAIVRVYRVGEVPEELVDENPLYAGRPLRPDGTCDQTGRSWAGVPLEIRQFLRVGMGMGAIRIMTLSEAHSYIDAALRPDAVEYLRLRYQGVAARYDILAKETRLPTLKMRLKGEPTAATPLSAGQKVEWGR
jgi:hypothetical protein